MILDQLSTSFNGGPVKKHNNFCIPWLRSWSDPQSFLFTSGGEKWGEMIKKVLRIQTLLYLENILFKYTWIQIQVWFLSDCKYYSHVKYHFKVSGSTYFRIRTSLLQNIWRVKPDGLVLFTWKRVLWSMFISPKKLALNL